MNSSYHWHCRLKLWGSHRPKYQQQQSSLLLFQQQFEEQRYDDLFDKEQDEEDRPPAVSINTTDTNSRPTVNSVVHSSRTSAVAGGFWKKKIHQEYREGSHSSFLVISRTKLAADLYIYLVCASLRWVCALRVKEVLSCAANGNNGAIIEPLTHLSFVA